MCGYFNTGFIDFILVGKSLTDFKNLFPTNNLVKNNEVSLNYFLNWDIKMNQTSINGKIKMFQPSDNRIDFRKSIESKAILLLKFEKDRQSKHSVNILQHLINLGWLN